MVESETVDVLVTRSRATGTRSRDGWDAARAGPGAGDMPASAVRTDSGASDPTGTAEDDPLGWYCAAG